LGSHWDYAVDTEIGELFVSQAEGAGYRPGESLHLRLQRDRLALVSGEPPAPGA
jgi:hypothetical protein